MKRELGIEKIIFNNSKYLNSKKILTAEIYFEIKNQNKIVK